jgi:hypothetical protein
VSDPVDPFPSTPGVSVPVRSGAAMALTALLEFLRTPRGVLLLLTLWPTLLGALGLPTGAAERALTVYRGVLGAVEAPAAPCTPSAGDTSGAP